nr:odorant receptor 49b-like [Aedes albopictus]
MLLQFAMCIVIVCLTMVTLTLARDNKELLINMVIILVYIFGHLLVYSVLATDLITASTSVADAMYGTQWYDWTIPEQRNVLTVLCRSQRMAALTIGKFFNINHNTVGKTLQTTYSHFTVLRQLIDSH